jgi:hypothetical protein
MLKNHICLLYLFFNNFMRNYWNKFRGIIRSFIDTKREQYEKVTAAAERNQKHNCIV